MSKHVEAHVSSLSRSQMLLTLPTFHRCAITEQCAIVYSTLEDDRTEHTPPAEFRLSLNVVKDLMGDTVILTIVLMKG